VAKVLLQDEIILPPHSLIEVMARVDTPTVDCGCVPLAEDLATSSSQQMQWQLPNSTMT